MLAERQPLSALRVDAAEHATRPPARYTEASLVKELEDREIGRPSTYASIGSEIYALWMRRAHRLDITEVHASPAGDTRCGAIDKDSWQEVARERHAAGGDDSVDFSYVTYRRR